MDALRHFSSQWPSVALGLLRVESLRPSADTHSESRHAPLARSQNCAKCDSIPFMTAATPAEALADPIRFMAYALKQMGRYPAPPLPKRSFGSDRRAP
jgi:hypothetical protein